MPTESYGLSKQVHSSQVAAPDFAYLPRLPNKYRPKLGLVGAGGVSEYHLRAYRALGLEVAAICDLDLDRARKRQREFYPEAQVCGEFAELAERNDIEVVDVALHPEHRTAVIETALAAGKHVLTQKPFALDVDEAERLVALADKHDLKLAVNQNGRWAPHFAYALAAFDAGLLGEIASVDFNLSFDHSWTVGTPFENIHHLILYDFGVHWFDLAACFLSGRELKRVYASVARAGHQKARPPFLASAIIDAEGAQVRLAFNAAVSLGQADRTIIAGSRGTLESSGPSLSQQTVVLTTATGASSVQLSGTWFENGFQGTMCELLCAIEEQREPRNSARNNIRTLALCFAALTSANTGQPVRPGAVRRLPE